MACSRTRWSPTNRSRYPPIGSGIDGRDVISRDYGGYARPEDYWSPRNADYSRAALFTMRRGLGKFHQSRDRASARRRHRRAPEKSLDDVCATAVAAKIYAECVRYYPFMLGAQPVRMIDLAAFYAAVANEGALPQPHGIDSIEQNGQTVYEYPKTPLPWIGAADRASFYQLKTMLQGVVARGTARGIGGLSPYVAGKTGTTEDAVDGWFVGFTNDVTVAVWVGYDNADGKRRSLGTNETGARVALPIFQPIIEAIWAEHIAPKTPLSRPSPEAQRQLVDIPIDYMTGDRVDGSGNGFIEHLRRALRRRLIEHFADINWPRRRRAIINGFDAGCLGAISRRPVGRLLGRAAERQWAVDRTLLLSQSGGSRRRNRRRSRPVQPGVGAQSMPLRTSSGADGELTAFARKKSRERSAERWTRASLAGLVWRAMVPATAQAHGIPHRGRELRRAA